MAEEVDATFGQYPFQDLQHLLCMSFDDRGISLASMNYKKHSLNHDSVIVITEPISMPISFKCMAVRLVAKCSPRFISAKTVTVHRRPSNLWFDGECRQSKREVIRLERSSRCLKTPEATTA